MRNHFFSEPVNRTVEISFTVNFKDAHFSPGCVSFTKHIPEINQEISFQILNEHILGEFEDIKNWFAKKIGNKFTVNAVIETRDGRVTELHATSPKIETIGQELIDVIKEERTLTLFKSLKTQTNKSLFSADEIFKQIDSDDTEGNVFYQGENDVLSILLEKGNIRNKKNLDYLSGEKQSEKHKIKFTLHPVFGFLFLVVGEAYNHFIWELQNSNATYLWSVEKSEDDIESEYKRIEETINTVTSLKRERYKQEYKSGLVDTDLKFYSIDHDKITTDEEESSIRWKDK